VLGVTFPERSPSEQVRLLTPVFAVGAAVLAVVADPSSGADVLLCGLAAAPFFVWILRPRIPLLLFAFAVIVPAVAAQRSGQLEPLLFEVSLLGLVIGLTASPRAASVALLLLAMLAPVAASVVQDPPEISVGIWLLAIVFSWFFGRVARRQDQLLRQLEATRRELARQALLVERRRIARDVHDFVGHGLAAVMLQLTSARHVLHRDPAAAEEAMRSAEQVGRRSMRELRRTVALLRSDDESAPPPLPSPNEIPALVADARAGGLVVELRMRGDHSAVEPRVGVALYRIAQEALANAARHAPLARTVLELEIAGGRASLVAETTGPTAAVPAADAERPHYGLIGMRERATALGGELSAGPTAEGWLMSCTLPLEAEEAFPDEDGSPR
jgi:signal transduction histidine kinase